MASFPSIIPDDERNAVGARRFGDHAAAALARRTPPPPPEPPGYGAPPYPGALPSGGFDPNAAVSLLGGGFQPEPPPDYGGFQPEPPPMSGFTPAATLQDAQQTPILPEVAPDTAPTAVGGSWADQGLPTQATQPTGPGLDPLAEARRFGEYAAGAIDEGVNAAGVGLQNAVRSLPGGDFVVDVLQEQGRRNLENQRLLRMRDEDLTPEQIAQRDAAAIDLAMMSPAIGTLGPASRYVPDPSDFAAYMQSRQGVRRRNIEGAEIPEGPRANLDTSKKAEAEYYERAYPDILERGVSEEGLPLGSETESLRAAEIRPDEFPEEAVRPIVQWTPPPAAAAPPAKPPRPPKPAPSSPEGQPAQPRLSLLPGGEAVDRVLASYEKPPLSLAVSDATRLEQARRNAVRAWTDRGVDLSILQKEARRALGRPLNADEMASELRRLNPDKAAEVRLQEGLRPALLEVGEDRNYLDAYLTLQDNADVARSIGNPDRKFSEGLRGEDTEPALASLAERLGPERMARVEQAAQRVWAFGRSLLQRKLDAGVIDQALYDDLTTRYPHYVPTRILDYLKEDAPGLANGKSLSLRDTGLRRLTEEGTERSREAPTAALWRLAYETEAIARKNETFNAFLRLRQAVPDARAAIRPVPHGYTTKRGETLLTGFVDGTKQTYAVPSELAAAVKLEEVQAAPAGIAKLMGLYRALITSKNPAFLVGNAALDAVTSTARTVSREGGNPLAVPGIVRDLGAAYVDAFNGLLRGEYRGETARFLREGGGMFGHYASDPTAARRSVADLARPSPFTVRSAGDVGRIVKDVLSLKPIEAVGERIELAPRVAAMRRAERRGADTVRSVIAGRDVTIDFARGGTWAKALNAWVPFFNVGMQAGAALPRAFRENPKGFVGTVATLLVAPVVAAEAWNNADPQRKRDYEDVPDYVKDRSIVLMLPVEAPTDARGNRQPQYVELRLREWAPAAIWTREIARKAMGESGRSWDELAMATVGGVSPIQGAGAADVLTQLTTPVVSTGLQLAFNKDAYRNRAIVSEVGDERASALSRTIAQATGRRPSEVEFALQDLGGGVARMATAASDLATGRTKGSSAPQDIPVLGGVVNRFVGRQTGQRLEEARDDRLSPAVRSAMDRAGIRYEPSPVRGEVAGVDLNRDEQTRFQEAVNKHADENIQKLLRSPSWEGKTAEFKEDQIKKQVAAARKKAAAEMERSIGAAEINRRKRAGSATPVPAQPGLQPGRRVQPYENT